MPGGRLKWLKAQQQKVTGLVIEPTKKPRAKKKPRPAIHTTRGVRPSASLGTGHLSSEDAETPSTPTKSSSGSKTRGGTKSSAASKSRTSSGGSNTKT